MRFYLVEIDGSTDCKEAMAVFMTERMLVHMVLIIWYASCAVKWSEVLSPSVPWTSIERNKLIEAMGKASFNSADFLQSASRMDQCKL